MLRIQRTVPVTSSNCSSVPQFAHHRPSFASGKVCLLTITTVTMVLIIKPAPPPGEPLHSLPALRLNTVARLDLGKTSLVNVMMIVT